MRKWMSLLAVLLVLGAAVVSAGRAWADHLSPLDCALPEFAGHPHCASTGTGDYPNDGRIGDWGGDYIIYCKNGFLEVWRFNQAAQQGELVAKFPLGDVGNLHQQGDSRYDPKSGTTVTRWGDRIEVSGWDNGNNRFGRNSNVFSARDCENSGSGFKNAREKLNALKARGDALVAFLFTDLTGTPQEQLDGVLKELLRLADEFWDLAEHAPDPDVRAEASMLAASLEDFLFPFTF